MGDASTATWCSRNCPGAVAWSSTPGAFVLCPFASRFPFETLILPKQHSSQFRTFRGRGLRTWEWCCVQCCESSRWHRTIPHTITYFIQPPSTPRSWPITIGTLRSPPHAAGGVRGGERALHQPRDARGTRLLLARRRGGTDGPQSRRGGNVRLIGREGTARMVFGDGPGSVPFQQRTETVLWKVTPEQEESSV